MLKIGEFSRLSRVSVRMLRYYDENNLLKPVKIDSFTGYRYYSESQLSIISMIINLKDMGFAVAAIGEILKCENNPQDLEKMFALQKAQLLEESLELKKRIRLLDTALDRLRKGISMNYTCEIKELKARYVASVRRVLPKYDEEGRLWHILFSETAGMNMSVCGVGMAILHDQEYKESDVDVEIQIEVDGHYEDTANVKFKTEPAMTVVSSTFKGPYSNFSDVYAGLAAWAAENKYEFDGPMMDIYHVGPNETRNPDEFVTEVCCPIKK